MSEGLRHEMFHELPPEGEKVKLYHEELHGEHLDARDFGVAQWFDRREHLASYPPEELQAVRQELENIPEVREHARERVTLDSIRGMMDLAHEYIPKEKRLEFAPTELLYQDLQQGLADAIDRYAASVCRFQSTEIARFRLDREQYQAMMQNSDRARRTAHEALIGQLNATSRFLIQRVPKEAGRQFDHAGWEKALQQGWFSIDQLKDRNYIAGWAIREDIVEKTRAIESAIDDALEQKSADAG